jgi:hypothetical protein
VNSPLNVKENYEYALDFALHFPLGGLLLCLVVINPALVSSDNPGQESLIIGGDFMKLLADVDISCQTSHQARYMTSNKRT